jgi:hypothetical protein
LDDFTDPIWLALVEGKQTGPLDARALADWARRGQVTVDTYFWRRGMSEWRRGADLPELQYLFGAGVVERSPDRPPSAAATSLAAFASDVVPPLPGGVDARDPAEEPSLGISGIWTASRKSGRRTIAGALIGGLTVFGVALFALTLLGSVSLRGEREADPRIGRAIAEIRTALQGCLDQALREDPGLRGSRFQLTAIVSSSGEVRRASVDRREIDTSALGQCLKLRAGRMMFAPFSAEDVEIHVPLSVGTRL